jgi:hypothetical protein
MYKDLQSKEAIDAVIADIVQEKVTIPQEFEEKLAICKKFFNKHELDFKFYVKTSHQDRFEMIKRIFSSDDALITEEKNTYFPSMTSSNEPDLCLVELIVFQKKDGEPIFYKNLAIYKTDEKSIQALKELLVKILIYF